MKTYKVRAYPTKQTEGLLLEQIETCRILYNMCLEERISAYKKNKIFISRYDQTYEITSLRKEFQEFKKVNADALANVPARADMAFNRIFFPRLKKGKKPKYPRFKSEYRYRSITFRGNGWKLRGNRLFVSNVGSLKLKISQEIAGGVKTLTIVKTRSEKWFALFACEDAPKKEYPKTVRAVGIDVGINPFLHDTENSKIENPRHLKKSSDILTKRHKDFNRKQKGSKRFEKSRKLLSKAHEKVYNQRKDFLHKVSNYYVTNYQVIAVEDLDLRQIVENVKGKKNPLAGDIRDCSWGILFNLISYKAEDAGRKFVKVDPRGTTQECSGCGCFVLKDLSVKVHDCPECGLLLDRNHNSAWNILDRALSHIDKDGLEFPERPGVGQALQKPEVSEYAHKDFLCGGVIHRADVSF